jgi:alpha-L-fucosidase
MPLLRLSRLAMLLITMSPSVRAGQVASGPNSGAVQATPKSNASRRWFEDAKFGLTIRWGLYSLLEKDEWVMEHDKLPITQYAKLLPRFNASRFDAASWVKAAKAAGARYLTVTAKHHDGFCMFATKLTDYDIVDATPYHSDPIKMLAECCHREGIKLFFSYSLLDWHHPDYFPLGKTGQSAGRDAKGQWDRYVAYYQAQIRELCTNYGEIGGLRLDGCWDRPDADWQLAGTYRVIHDLQPRALIASESRQPAISGEDFRVTKLNIASEERSVLQKLGASSSLPLEICWPLSDTAGHDGSQSRRWNVEQVVHGLVAAAAAGANLTLELRAAPDGGLDQDLAKTLAQVGEWLGKYGHSVYGTRRGPIPPQPWGFSTARGSPEQPSEIYLHVVSPRDDVSVVFDPASAWVPYSFGKTVPLRLTRTARGLVLELEPKDRMPIDTIVTLLPRKREPPPKAR